MIKTNLIGIPLDLGAKNLGVDIGPDAFRYLGFVEKLESSGFLISDLGNITVKDRRLLKPGNSKLKYLDEIINVSNQSAKITYDHILQKERVVVIGGDHSACLGPISGASSALSQNLGLIYFDAHGDLNTDKTTITGNIHGMQLASLLGFGNEKLKTVFSKNVKIKKENLIHIGGSDFDKAEDVLVTKEKVKCFKMFDILENGFSPIFKSIKKLGKNIPNVWVSLDLDAIDAIYAPAAGMPNRAGLSYREITTVFEFIGKVCNVVGVDVVEYNPLQDIDGKTAELAIELIAKLFGTNYSWYTNYLKRNSLD